MRPRRKTPHPNPIIKKLLDLKYRIDDSEGHPNWFASGGVDGIWVTRQIDYLRCDNDNKLQKADLVFANRLWKKYAG